ncbi:MAG: LuxR C-terminal-related transcriptional regulator [Oscillospiraceae bacterium]|nr:LuxR C-terminal-related transcriptional regulator [Oscillospiraceae bacterium]MCL2279703.1 LuxR C-terminal-related transcriptional regulator [Oscillospiraceae bacterium]
MSENNRFSISDSVPRDALVKKMKRISATNNIFIAAPGGYGKSTVARQWLLSVRGKTATIVLGEADNDPEVFYLRLADILQKLMGEEKKSGKVYGISFGELLEIIGQLPEKRTRHYLLVDDVHMITNEEIESRIPVLLSRLPSYICVCLVGRSQLAEAALENGRFEVITQDDLLFSEEEIQWLGEEKDCILTDAQVKDLQTTTGGWAMYLSALISDGGIDEAMENTTPQTLAQYLETHVWKLWDNETKNQLLKLAAPLEVTPELCERLTGVCNGQDVLEMLAKKENAFLTSAGEDTWRFHDIFREFLLERVADVLSEEEQQRVNDITGNWYYEQGEYFTGVHYYYQNGDYEGIVRCEQASMSYAEQTEGTSLEAHYNSTSQFVLSMPLEFIEKEPFLIIHCSYVAYLLGDCAKFLLYQDILYQKYEVMLTQYPEFLATYFFMSGLDFRISLKNICMQIAEVFSQMPESTTGETAKGEVDDNVRTSSVTQNLPYFHRSMRDFSEIYEMETGCLALINETFGTMIGKDWQVLKPSLIAGICYERSQLIDALHHSLSAYNFCESDTHPEAVFCAYTILAEVLYEMGAVNDAGKIMKQTEHYIKDKARFLYPNFKALQTKLAVRAGDVEAAQEWLTVFACRLSRLPLHQMCQHFTTLRCFIAVGDFPAAVKFGERLLTLAREYNRPLDQIESSILTAIALQKKDGTGKQLEQAVAIAEPYGFTQMFINEGKEILPLLWEVHKEKEKPLARFSQRLIDEICEKNNLKSTEETAPKLSKQQLTMLSHLSKGMTYSEIAETVGLGRGTVKSHILLVYKRLGVQRAQEAIIKAKMLGLLE